MANYQILKADIDEKIYENAQQKITGENLNSILNAMVATLGAEYQFAGVATIDTNPETSDAKVFYIANGKGKYTNFGNIEVTEDDVVILYNDTSWHKVATGIASHEKLTELEVNLYELTRIYDSKKQSSKGLDSNGKFVSINFSFCSPEFVPIGHVKRFNYNLRTEAGNLIIAFYSSNDENSFISGIESRSNAIEGIVEVPSNAKYMRFCTYDWGDDAYGYFITTVLDTNKITPQSITRDKLALNSVSTDQIALSSITTDHIGTLDSTPINTSRNLITSGGVFDAIEQSENKSAERFNEIEKSVDSIEKSIGLSKFVGVSIQEQSGINISNAPFCGFTKSKGIRIKGQGSKRIVLLYSEGVAVGDIISLGIKVPYSTQDVANVQLAGGWAIEKPFVSNKTKSNKGYKLQGETYQRVNYKVSGSIEHITQIVITTDNATDNWEIWVSSNALINDIMPLAPIMYVYDGGHWDGVVNYNGQSMSIWSLHRALGIPYTIAMTEGEYNSEPCQQEVLDDIASGFADVITRVGSPYDYKDSDSNVITNIIESINNCLDGNVGADSMSCVFATHAFDKDVLRCVKKSGIEMVRTYPTSDGVEKYGVKFGDYDLMMLSPQSVNYGSSMPTEFMGFPIILWAHGIGTPQSAHEQSLSGMYADANGSQTIAAMQNIMIAQGNGNAATFKASDFIAFCKKYK